MFYDWKLSEMVHPGSTFMTGMFSCILCVFVCLKSIHICFSLGSRMFVIYHKSKYSSVMFYDLKLSEMVHPGQVLMTGMFPVFCICFSCQKSIHICFFHATIFWKSCISSEHFNCDNSHFSPSDLVLQLLRATKWCRNIFLIFSKNFHLNQRCGDDGCKSHVLDDLLFFRPSR